MSADQLPGPVCPYCGFHEGRHWYRCSQWQPPRRYRWVTEGEWYRYSAAPGKGLDERRGQLCWVVRVRSAGRGPGNVLVQFHDDERHMVSALVLRPLHKAQPTHTSAARRARKNQP